MTTLWTNFADYVTQAGDLLIAHPILSIIATYLLVGYADGVQAAIQSIERIEIISKEDSE